MIFFPLELLKTRNTITFDTCELNFCLFQSVQLFTVEAADCFMLQENELIIPDGINQHDFLNK